jgi:AcrR family transcriptional regulator
MTTRRLNTRTLRGESARYERPSSAKEAAILQAATRLFGEKGRGARTADIAAAAGVTERTLFRYFPSKDRLYQRVMFPALLAATMPRELTETAKLFAADSETFPRLARAGAEAQDRRSPSGGRAIPADAGGLDDR